MKKILALVILLSFLSARVLAIDIITVENTTASDISINDMGKIISANTKITLTETATFSEISESNDLSSLVNTGSLILGDGDANFSASDAVKMLTPFDNTTLIVMNATSGTMLFVDSSGNEGAIYGADYSAGFGDRSLVDKGYVSSNQINIYTSDGTVVGGQRTYTGEQNNTLTFSQYNTDATTFTTGTEKSIGSNALEYSAFLGDGAGNITSIAEIHIANTGANTGLVFINTINDKGAVYFADYSAGFVDESLVSKKYVDSHPANAGGSDTQLQYNKLGALEGAESFTITNAGKDLNVSTAGTIRVGTVALSIFHDTSNSVLVNQSGGLILQQDANADLTIRNIDADKDIINRLGSTTDTTHFNVQDSASANLFTVTAAGDVGVNKVDPDALLHIFTSDSSTNPPANADLVLEKSGNSIFQFLGVNGDHQEIRFHTSTNNVQGKIGWNEATTPGGFQLKTGTNDLGLVVDQNQQVGMGPNAPTNPLTALHVKEADAGAVSPVSGTTITTESNVANYISLLAPNAIARGILFGEPSSASHGEIIYSGNVTSGFTLSTNNNVNSILSLGADQRIGVSTNTPGSKFHIVENTTVSDATAGLTIEQIGSGEALLHFKDPFATFTMGMDGGDDNDFYITPGSSINTSQGLNISRTTGRVSIGAVTGGTNQLNVAGDINTTTAYNIGLSVEVLNATTLGNGVVNSSLTNVGTLSNLTVAGTVTASSFNGVALTTGGVSTNYLDETGVYSAPTGSQETLAETLANGNITGGTNIVISSGDSIITSAGIPLNITSGADINLIGNTNITGDLTVLTDGNLGFGFNFFTQDIVLGAILQLTDPTFSILYDGKSSLRQLGTSSALGILSENSFSGQDAIGNSRVYGALETSIEDNTSANFTGSMKLKVAHQGNPILDSILGVNVNQQKEVFIYDNIRFNNLGAGVDPILTANAIDKTLSLDGDFNLGTNNIKFSDGSALTSTSDIFNLFSEDSFLLSTNSTNFFTVQLQSDRNTVGTFGHLDFNAKDTGGATTIYGAIDGIIVDPGNGIETGAIRIGVTQDSVKDVPVIGFNELDRLETLIHHDLQIKNQGTGPDPVFSSNNTSTTLDLSGNLIITSPATTQNALYVNAPSLTNGYAAQFYSNSSDPSNRRVVSIVNDNLAASGAIPLYIRQDSTADIVNIFDGETEVFTIFDGGNVNVIGEITASSIGAFGLINQLQYNNNGVLAGTPGITLGASGLELDAGTRLDFGDNGDLQFEWSGITGAGSIQNYTGEFQVVNNSGSDLALINAGFNGSISLQTGSSNSLSDITFKNFSGVNMAVFNSDGAINFPTGVVTAQQGIVPSGKTNAEILAISSPVGGHMVYSTDDNFNYQYDASRSKWLSTHTTAFQFGSDGNTDNDVIQYNGITSVVSGPLMPRNGTVVSVTGFQNGGNVTKGYEIRQDNVSIFALSLVASKFISNTVNADFSANTLLTAFAVALDTSATDPTALVTVRWRL